MTMPQATHTLDALTVDEQLTILRKRYRAEREAVRATWDEILRLEGQRAQAAHDVKAEAKQAQAAKRKGSK